MATATPTIDLMANHNAEVISISIIFVTLSLLSVVARLVSRKMQHLAFGADDILLVCSWILAAAECAMFAAGTHFAKGGWHINTLTPDHLVAFQKSFYAASFLQSTALALAKLSILILLYRIFVTRRFRITVCVLAGIVTSWWAAIFFGGAFICYPATHIWSPQVQGTCGNQELLNLISPIPWVLTDFAILISPIPVIRQLQLSKEKKIRVSAMFLLGGLTCIVSVIRYRTLFYPVSDVPWDIIPATDWSIIEVNITIICAALIASRPVVKRLLPERLASSLRSKWALLTDLRSSPSSRSRMGAGSSSRVAYTSKNGGPTESAMELREQHMKNPVYNARPSDIGDRVREEVPGRRECV